MRNYKLIIEYDGTHYVGFQVQPKGVTIQGALEDALEKLFCRKIRIISCGRTDRGVHAKAHVVNFKVDSTIQPPNIVCALNRYLPVDIAVKKIISVPLDFHAQYSTKHKTYEYTIHMTHSRSPLTSRYVYQCAYDLDICAMKKALPYVVGTHDFRAFASQVPASKNTIRTITKARLICRRNQIKIRLTADGFLYNMVRNIVGTLLLVGQGKISYADFRNILSACDRTKAGSPVPPQGLCLISVKY